LGLGLAVALLAGCGGKGTSGTTASTGSSSTATSQVTQTSAAAAAIGSSTWTKPDPSGTLPNGRNSFTLVYDESLAKAILFGGFEDTDYLNDTWAYSPGTNTWSDLNPSSFPGVRYGQAMVYDSSNGKMIMFGGYNDNGPFNDTWEYDPGTNAWTNLRPSGTVPDSRYAMSMVYDSASGKVIMFGGLGAMSPFNDTWTYDPNSNTWANLNPSGTVPEARGGHSMVYDPVTDKTILFAGSNGKHGGDLNDTWQYDAKANKWTNLNPAGGLPPARDSFSFAYDSSHSRVVIYGGYDGSGFLSDTWAYSLQTNTWTDLKPTAASPSALQGQSMIYDPSSHEVIMFGGYDGTKSLNETWTVH
jgi:N-acetylneuraminic acid mutarotase